MQKELSEETSQHWLHELEKESVPCARVNNLKQAINDEQIQYRKMVVDVPHPEGGSVKVPGNPIKLSSITDEQFTSPPLLGEHTKEILEDWLDFKDEELIELDKRLLKNYYLNEGYYNVKINTSFAKLINKNEFELIFNIIANKKIYFGDIIRGNNPPPDPSWSSSSSSSSSGINSSRHSSNSSDSSKC